METVTYPYAGRQSVKNNDEARARAKRELGQEVLISHIGWKHEAGDTLCVVEYLSPGEATAHDRAPDSRKSLQRNNGRCRPAHVHNALLEMGAPPRSTTSPWRSTWTRSGSPGRWNARTGSWRSAPRAASPVSSPSSPWT